MGRTNVGRGGLVRDVLAGGCVRVLAQPQNGIQMQLRFCASAGNVQQPLRFELCGILGCARRNSNSRLFPAPTGGRAAITMPSRSVRAN